MTGDALASAIRHANEALDWIEARQGPLPGDGYARIETSVAVVRALGGRGEMGEDDGHLFDAWQDEGGAWRMCCARAPGDHPGVTQRLFGDQAGRMVTYSIDLDAAREWSARWKACAKRLRERVAALESAGNAMAVAALSEGGEELSEDAAIDVVMAAFEWAKLVDFDAALAEEERAW